MPRTVQRMSRSHTRKRKHEKRRQRARTLAARERLKRAHNPKKKDDK